MISDLLTKEEAWAIAEFCKRVGWTDLRQLAADDDEADAMQAAFIKIAKEFARTGFSPR